MPDEQKIIEQLKEYQELAKTDKNIDLGALALSTLSRVEENRVSGKNRALAYFISFGFPPFGLFFAIYYFLNEKDDARSVAIWCVILTLASFLLIFVVGSFLFSSSGIDYNQLQQINPDDIRSLVE